MFNADEFLNSSVEGANATQVEPIPVGEYTAVIDSIKVRPWVSKKDPSLSGQTMDVTWVLDAPAVAEQLGRQKLTARQGIMLDFTDDGRLDMGKGRNVGLGRLREATNLNNPGQAFSPSMLMGQMAKVKVGHRVEKDQIFVEVESAVRLA